MAEMDTGYILGATPFATRTARLSGVEFDTVIFDEASQVTLPLAVMGMLVAQKFIFICFGLEIVSKDLNVPETAGRSSNGVS